MSVRVAVVTGSRAEFGLLDPVMHAIEAHPALELLVLVTGAHLLTPGETRREVAARYQIAATIPMQRDGEPTSRPADAAALGRGVAGIAGALVEHRPGWVVVLGDRIEAFAAACAASVGGVPLAHLHGGDRAEGIADEAMRHAITKLAHLHLPATALSAERIIRMGENPANVHVVGSPAIDGLRDIAPMPGGEFGSLGSPEVVFLMHPLGRDRAVERGDALAALTALGNRRVLALHPNNDPGREGILGAIESSGVRSVAHLPRERFIALCKRIAPAGAIVGNSSAGLIEASALGLPAVNIGRRQSGRERAGNVFDCQAQVGAIAGALDKALRSDRSGYASPFGDGRAGERVAALLAGADPADPGLLSKRCAY
jgi:UDP-hydrolysing UDP-N-acetyl-D-glucosamine 2-epimerase